MPALVSALNAPFDKKKQQQVAHACALEPRRPPIHTHPSMRDLVRCWDCLFWALCAPVLHTETATIVSEDGVAHDRHAGVIHTRCWCSTSWHQFITQYQRQVWQPMRALPSTGRVNARFTCKKSRWSQKEHCLPFCKQEQLPDWRQPETTIAYCDTQWPFSSQVPCSVTFARRNIALTSGKHPDKLTIFTEREWISADI